MSFFGFKNDDVDVFCMNNNSYNNQEDDLAMFELTGGGGNDVGVVDNNVGRIENNSKNKNHNKNHDNSVITVEDDLAMFELGGGDAVVIDGHIHDNNNDSNDNNGSSSKGKKKKKETKSKSSSSSYYNGLFKGCGSLLEPINIDGNDNDNDDGRIKCPASRKKSTPRRRPVPVPVITIDDDDDDDDDDVPGVLISVVAAASASSFRSRSFTATATAIATTPTSKRNNSNSNSNSNTAISVSTASTPFTSTERGNHGDNIVRSVKEKGKTSKNNINNNKGSTGTTRSSGLTTMTNVKTVNRKRNRSTLRGGNKKVKTGNYSIVKEKPKCFDVVKTTTNRNNYKNGNGDGNRNRNDIGRQKQDNGDDTSRRNVLTVTRKEKKKDNKNNDNLKDAVKGRDGNNDISSSDNNDNNNNIEKKRKKNKRKGKKQRNRSKEMKEGNSSNSNTNHPTNQEVLVSQDPGRMAIKDRPISKGNAISPKSVLCHYYKKKPDSVQVTANNYLTWDKFTKNGKTWDNKHGRKPKRQFTSIFVCPITKEAFLAGPWGGGGKGWRSGRICWYSCNIMAEHAAAARAWDCLLLREGGNLRDFRLGGLEPYWPMKRPPWPAYIEVPSSIQQRLPREYQHFVHSDEKCTTKNTNLRINEDPGSVRIESSTSHNATNLVGNLFCVPDSDAIDELAQPLKKSVSFQQKETIPTIFNQKNDGATTLISSTNANTIQNKLNSIDRVNDQFFQQQQQQQQYDEFGRCQSQLSECVPEKIQTTTENSSIKEKGNNIVGKIPVKMSLSIIEACTEKEKNRIHEIDKDIICSDTKIIKMEGGSTSCVQKSFKNENSDADVPLITLRTEKLKRIREHKPQVIKTKEEIDCKEDVPPIALKKKSETTTHNSQPPVIKIKEEADCKKDVPLIVLKKKSETTTHDSQPQVTKIREDIDCKENVPLIAMKKKSETTTHNSQPKVIKVNEEEADSKENVPLIALKKKSETTTHNSQPQVIKIKEEEADSRKDVPLIALKKSSETTTHNSLPPVYANNQPSIQIISTSQKQSSNSSINDIASDPIEEDTITRITFQNRSKNQLYKARDADKPKSINESNDTVDRTVTPFAIKDTHMKASVEIESCAIGIRRNEAKISSFLEHVYGYLPNTPKKQQIEIIDVDTVECLNPKAENENTLDSCFSSTEKETRETIETNIRTNLTKKVMLDPKADCNLAASKSVKLTKPRFKPQKDKKAKKVEEVSIDLIDEDHLPKNDHIDTFNSVETKATATPHNLNPVQLRILLAASKSSSSDNKKRRRTSDKEQRSATTNNTTASTMMMTTTTTNITNAVKVEVEPSLKRKGDDGFAVVTIPASKRRAATRRSKSVEPIEISEDHTSPEKKLPTLEEGENTKARNIDIPSPKTDCNLAASKSVEPIGIVEYPTSPEKSLPTKPRFKPQKNKRTKKAEKVLIDLTQNLGMIDSSRAPHSHNCLSPTDEGRLPKNDHPKSFDPVLNKKGEKPEKPPTNINSLKYSPPSPERRFIFHSSTCNGKLKPVPRPSSKPVHVDVFNGMALQDALIQQERLLRSAAARVRTNIAFRVTTKYMINPIRSKTFTVLVRDIHLQYSDHWKYTNYYSRLGLPSNANASVVRAAYRRLCLVYHPDRNIGKPDTKRKFQAVTEAYHSLMNSHI